MLKKAVIEVRLRELADVVRAAGWDPMQQLDECRKALRLPLEETAVFQSLAAFDRFAIKHRFTTLVYCRRFLNGPFEETQQLRRYLERVAVLAILAHMSDAVAIEAGVITAERAPTGDDLFALMQRLDEWNTTVYFPREQQLLRAQEELKLACCDSDRPNAEEGERDLLLRRGDGWTETEVFELRWAFVALGQQRSTGLVSPARDLARLRRAYAKWRAGTLDYESPMYAMEVAEAQIDVPDERAVAAMMPFLDRGPRQDRDGYVSCFEAGRGLTIDEGRAKTVLDKLHGRAEPPLDRSTVLTDAASEEDAYELEDPSTDVYAAIEVAELIEQVEERLRAIHDDPRSGAALRTVTANLLEHRFDSLTDMAADTGLAVSGLWQAACRVRTEVERITKSG